MIRFMTCTCPYAADGNYCKHMAAVLYKIEEGEADTKIPANYFEKVQDQKRELQEVIAGIPIKELPEIVFSQATSDDFLYNRIMTKYALITPRHMIRLKQQVNDIGYHYSDRSGFVDYYHATDYTDALKKHFPNEVRDIYVQYVKKGAIQTADRKAYKYLMSYLKKITKYPNGKKIAQDIAESWRQDYKRRPAMMDELRKAGF